MKKIRNLTIPEMENLVADTRDKNFLIRGFVWFVIVIVNGGPVIIKQPIKFTKAYLQAHLEDLLKKK